MFYFREPIFADGAASTTGGGGGGGGGGGRSGDAPKTMKRLQEATQEELVKLVKHQSARLKDVDEEYGKLKAKVRAMLYSLNSL